MLSRSLISSHRRPVMTISLFVLAVALSAKAIDLIVSGFGGA